MSEWYTIIQLSDKTGIGETTLRRYVRDHGHFLKTKTAGRNRMLISSESIPIIQNIAELKAKGFKRDEINQSLFANEPMSLTIQQEQKGLVTLDEVLGDVRELLKQICEQNIRLSELNEENRIEMQKLRNEIAELKQMVDKQQKKRSRRWWPFRK